jgi:hypothetical protein
MSLPIASPNLARPGHSEIVDLPDPSLPLPDREGRHYRLDEAGHPLANLVLNALIASGRGPLAKIKVFAEGDHVRLEGVLPTYYLKQLAQQTAMSIPGVARVDCRLTVN